MSEQKEREEMTSICFIGTYKPLVCGIADYTDFIIRAIPHEAWGMLSFDPAKYDAAPISPCRMEFARVWYGIPGRHEFSASNILGGLKELGMEKGKTVLWFQHEMGIWADSQGFVAMCKHLDMPKIVTFHTLHFQSLETPSGLLRHQYDLLLALLPHVEAITVFSYGVYQAVTLAFPQYREKVYIMRHGIHSYPQIGRLSRKKAREILNGYLLYESDLDPATKGALQKQRIFLDPGTVVIGQTGFLCPSKYSESLYIIRDELQKLVPHKKIVAVRIGSPREESQKAYARQLRNDQNMRDKFLLEIWLPRNMLPLAQRAFDLNFYWPEDCTQSGILAHALGAGAIIAGRDLEGSGETLRSSGAIVAAGLDLMVAKIKNLIVNPDIGSRIEEDALAYAAEFSWENQAKRHHELAELISHQMLQSSASCTRQEPEVPNLQAIGRFRHLFV